MINLTLAVVWGLLGVGLLAYHFTTGEERTHLPGWTALLICAYNLARWWSYRAALAEKKAQWLARTRREHQADSRLPEYGDPNPDFMFGDEPPPKK